MRCADAVCHVRCLRRSLAATSCLLLTLWLIVATPPGYQCVAAEIVLPSVDPSYSIRVTAPTWAQAEERNNYEVLAFYGGCRLTQGELTASADEITLWIDRTSERGRSAPGKIVVYLNGNAQLAWSSGQSLKDNRWMGRLFSVHPVECYGQQVTRHDLPSMRDVPRLDWSVADPSRVITSQFVGPQSTLGNGVSLASGQQGMGGFSGGYAPPPLLGTSPQSSGGQQPQSGRGQVSSVPSSPGAVAWNPPGQTSPSAVAQQSEQQLGQTYGSVRNSPALPSSGLVIPQDGSAPYPATSPPQPSDYAQPSSPAGNASGPEQVPFPQEYAGASPYGGPSVGGLPEPAIRQMPQASGPTLPPAQLPVMAKNIQFSARGRGEQQVINFNYDPVADETSARILGGFSLSASGVMVPQADGSVLEFGSVSLLADNAVMWIKGRADGASIQQSTPERPLELYLEGNIVFSQGNRVIYADRMYYNVSSEYGMVLSAEVLTPVPQFQGLLRLKADVIQQRDRQHMQAYGAAITSSRLGVPRYWLQADEVEFTDERSLEEAEGLAAPMLGSGTGMRAKARNNFVYVGGVPVIYWPTFSTDLQDSSFYLSSIKLKNDNIFGFQTYLEWDVFQLLGLDTPAGTSLRLSTDYLSDRGPAVGLRYDYSRPTLLFGVPAVGFSDAWFIQDSGLDQIGIDRNALIPEEETRGRIMSRHRFFPSANWEALVETGWISDRNFLEQYFENEWEQQKDFTTSARLRRISGNRQFDLYAGVRVNDFFTETESLPRIDHHWLGQDLFRQMFTWSAKTSVSYSHQKVASTPTDPADAAKFTLLPWETDSEGARLITRQEISMPISMGAWKLVPFLSGEAGYWHEDVTQNDISRLTGQAGLRTSLPMWKVYPNIENRLFDLRGIAHKATFESEFFYADSNANLEQFPLYDSLDDNSQEHFQRRLIFNTFGGVLPPEFDQRNFALRSGMQRWVTAGSSEIVDDMTQLRFGVNNRWQTKRGIAGRERIVDLVALDVDFTVFPKAERDNFGEDVGVINYDFRYHIGDRLTFLSDGYFDVFSQGLKMISAGAQMSRPGRGDAYIGMLSIEGPISANILNGYTNYRLNEKWIINGGAAFDFGSTGSIGQSLGLVRIGESALVKVGMNIDHGRDNVSFNFSIEPRAFQRGVLGGLGGEIIPAVGSRGLE